MTAAIARVRTESHATAARATPVAEHAASVEPSPSPVRAFARPPYLRPSAAPPVAASGPTNAVRASLAPSAAGQADAKVDKRVDAKVDASAPHRHAAPASVRKRRPLTERPPDEAATPDAPLPEPDLEPLRLEATPPSPLDASLSFDAPTALTIQPARPSGAERAPPPARESANYRAVFEEAALSARRLHDALASDAARLSSETQGAAAAHATARQRALDESLRDLDGGLADARASLTAHSAATQRAVDERADAARLRIHDAASDARTAFRAQRAAIQQARKAPERKAEDFLGVARKHKKDIETAGTSSVEALRALRDKPEEHLPSKPEATGGHVEPCADAVQEAILTRTPPRAEHRAQAFEIESGKQNSALDVSFGPLTGATGQALAPADANQPGAAATAGAGTLEADFKKAFTHVDAWRAQTEAAGPAAVERTKDAVLAQIDEAAAKLREALRAGQRRTERALIVQHSAQRKQVFAAHRDRARGEAQNDARRADRDHSNLRALAVAQDVSLRVMSDGLRPEASHGEADFARIVTGTAKEFQRRVDTSAGTQRLVLLSAAALGAVAADRQNAADGVRLAGSARTVARQLDQNAGDNARALEQTANEATAGFPRLAEPIAAIVAGLVPPIARALTQETTRLDAAVDATGNRIERYYTTGNAGAGGGTNAAEGSTPSAKPAMVPETFFKQGSAVGRQPADDDKIRDLIDQAVRQVPAKMEEKAAAIWDGASATHTDVTRVMSALRSITAKQGAAIKALFFDQHHVSAESYLELNLWKLLSTDETNQLNLDAARAYLNGNDLDGALKELQAAVNWTNEEERVEAVQRSLTPARWAELRALHGAELADVRDDLDGVDKQVFKALDREADAYREVDGKMREVAPGEAGKGVAEADALRLREKIGRALENAGEAGDDSAIDRVVAAQSGAEGNVRSGSDALGLDEHRLASDAAGFDTSDATEDRNKKRWEQTKQAFDQIEASGGTAAPANAKAGWAIIAFAGRTREHSVYVADSADAGAYGNAGGYGGGHYETVKTTMRGEQQRLLQYVVDYGASSDEAAAARLAVETTRGGARPERLAQAMHAGVLDAREGEDKSALSSRDKETRVSDARARQESVLLKFGQIQRHGGLVPGDEEALSPEQRSQQADRVRDDLVKQVATQGDPTTDALNVRSVRAPGATWDEEQKARIGDATAGIGYAMAHDDKRFETLKRTLGQLDRKEVDQAFAAWDEAHPDHKLDQELNLGGQGSWWSEKLSGDERQEIELARMGVAKNDRERAEVSRMRAHQQIRDAGLLGTLAGKITGDYDALEQSRDDIERLMGLPPGAFDAFGRALGEGEARGNFDENGKFRPPAGGSVAEFELALRMTHLAAESYKAMTDRVANAVVTGLMVAAAVITTALTGGAAASIWIPLLVTFGAGVAGVALSASIKGNRYSRAEMERDMVVALVQSLTAGLGAAAGAAIKGGVPALRAAMISGEALQGVLDVAGTTALKGGWEFVAEMGVGAVSNAANNAAATAMDPVARARGESGSKALEAGLRGFLGGAVGSALMKPVGGLGGRAFGSFGARALGSAASNVGTRAVEMGLEHDPDAAPRQTADIFEELEGAGVQGIVQGTLEQAAEAGAARRSERRVARRAAATKADERTGARDTHDTHDTRETRETRPEPRASAALDGPAEAVAARAMTPESEHAAPATPPPLPLPPELASAVDTGRALAPETPVALPGSEAIPTPARAAAPEPEPEPVRPASGRRGDKPTEPPEPTEPTKPPPHGDTERPGHRRPPPLPPEAHRAIAWASDDFMEGVVMMDASPQSRKEIDIAYRRAIAADPTREVAVYRNPETGEHILVFGNADSVFIGLNSSVGEGPYPAEPAATRQDWKEILREDAGRWELEAHYHPGAANEHDQAPMWRRLPSTGEEGRGDFQVLRYESGAAGGAPRSSVIDFTHEGKPGHTVFGFDPADAKPYWIDVEHPATGAREQHRFATPEEYESWAQLHGAQPNVDTGAGGVRQGATHALAGDQGPVLPGAGKTGTKDVKLQRVGVDRPSFEMEDDLDAAWERVRKHDFEPDVVPPELVLPLRSEAERQAASAQSQAASRVVDLEGVEDFKVTTTTSDKDRRTVEHLMQLDHDGFMKVIGTQYMGAEEDVPRKLELRGQQVEESQEAREAVIRRPQSKGEEAALIDFEKRLIEKRNMAPEQAAAERESLSRLLKESGLRDAVDFAQNRKAWGEAIRARFAGGGKLSGELLDILLKSARLFTAAYMDPELVKERFDRMLEKAPDAKPTVDAFNAEWDSYMTFQIRPVVSENEATFNITRARDREVIRNGQKTIETTKPRGVLKSDSTFGHRPNRLLNAGGFDLVTFDLETPIGKGEPPKHAEVYLGDDKTNRGKHLGNVPAQTITLGQNLNQLGEQCAAAMEADRLAGREINPMAEKAVKQINDAAKAILDLERKAFSGAGEKRYRLKGYIEEVVKILDTHHIHQEVTSERGNIKTLSKLLERYGFTMPLADVIARDEEAPPSGKPTE
ncbi:hypothetical protein [Paraburkholderia atlantica]|uniref:hypothetical protein n=1 Tax=Paraburkholderia atlantica TaxID=2654982 RepID=UPI003D1C9373